MRATYYLESCLNTRFVAEQIAREQSGGHSRSWGGISNRSREANKAFVVSVDTVEARGNSLPLYHARPVNQTFVGRSAARVVIDYENLTPDSGIVEILNVALGECQHLAVVSALRLEDISLPVEPNPKFQGPPNFVDRLVADFGRRSFVCAPIKPSGPLEPSEAAYLAYEAALGGADIIKDDELSATHPEFDYAKRYRMVSAAISRTKNETGESKRYVANVICPMVDLEKRIEAAMECGADMLLVAPALQGQDVVSFLRTRVPETPIIVHGTYQTVASRLESYGLSLALWLKIQRYAGASAAVLPSTFGSFGYSPTETSSFLEACANPIERFNQCLPLHSGSVSPATIPYLHKLSPGLPAGYTAGSAIFDHPEGPRTGARAMRTAVDHIKVPTDGPNIWVPIVEDGYAI
ncbi:RuBisCO large subunit C-terminal-like domain-containing protein [Saccharothrix sp. NRRL B-16348]|uniref:RuBisCO large subunit C-terminal-like domain-containing protein n=1 Tax=Saccharothrix sp. NRRL B-16348 TaxID=1415542 RepID=UPI000A936027|nr:RuBisCO large subunit C-terminal-like domain-containing protein [Saccharothrix sp. NRRL B-16348]